MLDNQADILKLAAVDITAVDKADLVDVSGLTFDMSIPKEQRVHQILHTIKNPYCFRLGDMGVKLEFADNDRPLQDAFGDLLERKKGGL